MNKPYLKPHPYKPGAKVMDEKETRRRILNTGRQLGCEADMIIIFNETDRLLTNCTDQKEREHIAQFGALRLHMLLGGRGELEINGKKIHEGKK